MGFGVLISVGDGVLLKDFRLRDQVCDIINDNVVGDLRPEVVKDSHFSQPQFEIVPRSEVFAQSGVVHRVCVQDVHLIASVSILF